MEKKLFKCDNYVSEILNKKKKKDDDLFNTIMNDADSYIAPQDMVKDSREQMANVFPQLKHLAHSRKDGP